METQFPILERPGERQPARQGNQATRQRDQMSTVLVRLPRARRDATRCDVRLACFHYKNVTHSHRVSSCSHCPLMMRIPPPLFLFLFLFLPPSQPPVYPRLSQRNGESPQTTRPGRNIEDAPPTRRTLGGSRDVKWIVECQEIEPRSLDDLLPRFHRLPSPASLSSYSRASGPS